ncbi:D-sedoheptulose-7-phosphate isomerase [Runella slithyformis]|uniref:Phosphoheptose isomerase n=1 Tax=Runella slithyformis (strain ATCC 29530 / DSM 19594 / LMG 11500 / NCIMB 11436 / LSU 4) TaxID=761193 RepID=A0A7U4E7C5_RUNSL|nr:D-sedoheptulose 7-phosphate isomerase [Runella slithyformis]AEI50531.1 Phosphoheptose isomerase [Runella slithyformis DSM 19594]
MINIQSIVQASIDTKNRVLSDHALLETVANVADAMTTAFKNGKKVLFCGNGGSAADAQHLAAEFSGRFYYDRPPLYSEALHVNSSYVTAVGNDYSYDVIYSRMIEAMGKEGDVLVGISTSGNSTNVIKALEAANKLGMITVGMTGETGGKMKDVSTFLVNVPSKDTPRIQECHILLGHILCEIVEANVFPK